MSKLSKTAAAAKKAVEKGQQKQETALTLEEAVKHIRSNAGTGLFVPTDRWQMIYEDWKKAFTILNTHLTGRVYTSVEDAARQVLQVLVTTKGNLEDAEKALDFNEQSTKATIEARDAAEKRIEELEKDLFTFTQIRTLHG